MRLLEFLSRSGQQLRGIRARESIRDHKGERVSEDDTSSGTCTRYGDFAVERFHVTNVKDDEL